ncbi:translation factor GTPase family protein [Pleionea sp. CnH1-48]|uniref:GTP-binding protein n=1 Tax=Pleionea sp. CnH1-48 TaxID=2954494 RepID=UPI002097E80D|nr:TetM/TetW/TetO/TetS family tetracycline resistance ribosomal protection protein [Pleionea sp. CnH1-48]MCO7224239.1 TetM/TetW/TetO/TetS family tetracycline resistance ribosomal protection protein [Pleionea sp. CnH1-48]
MTQAMINLGILAHVDAGKTTLTEQILFAAGAIRQAGSVDKGTSATDSLSVERERGISVRVATETLYWNDHQINIIDTPGHVDFSAEVERSLIMLDAAVLVISAVEGVQSHTITLFQALRSLSIPTLIFINKLDRVGADVDRVMGEIHQELSSHALLLQEVSDTQTSAASIRQYWPFRLDADATDWSEAIQQQIIEHNENLLEAYLDDQTLSVDQIYQGLVASSKDGEIFPVLTGVAKQSMGIDDLLQAMVDFLPVAKTDLAAPLSAVVFKVEHDKQMGKMAYVRVFDGVIRSRDLLLNLTQQKEEKANQIKRVSRGKYVDVSEINAGDIGVISGLASVRVGDVLGSDSAVPKAHSLAAPLLTLQVKPQDIADFPALVAAFAELTDEDPLLDYEWLAEQRELHIKINGKIQIEILEAILLERFGLQAQFEAPSIIYKETPLASGEGYECYWMPKPCWAIVTFLIEPAERGSGIHYSSKVSVNDVAQKYQNEIAAIIPDAVKQGIKGWPVTDCRITLIKGEDHNVHSRPGDFQIATPMALLKGLQETETLLLEPILSFTIYSPLEFLGDITSDIVKMRGRFDGPEVKDNKVIIHGHVPAATSLDYAVDLASLTGGKAKMTTQLDGYEPCTLEQGKVTEYRGISPLDRDKWILAARGALK